MSKSLKKLIDINRLREFKNKLVGTGSAYVQTGAVDQTIAGTKTFSKPIAGSVTGSSGSCTGNAATATRADSAAKADTATNATALNIFASRPTDANIQKGDGSVRYFLATSSMKSNKPMDDAGILHLGWDTNGGFDSQLAITNPNGEIQTRSQNGGTWGNWKTFLNENNFNNYAPTKTGGGASGTWGINITGNANTATKATKAEQDGNGNNIVASYVAAGSEDDSTTDIGAFLAARPSFIKSFVYNNVWTDAISMRHRNGGADGDLFGTYIRSSAMGDVSNLLWNHQFSGTWQGERTLIDSANLAGFVKSGITIYDLVPDGAEAHNAMWGGRDITAAFDSGEFSEHVADGTFKDIFPGDYITKSVTISGETYDVTWVVADCDYWINKGDNTAMETHHVVIVPQALIFSANMNATNTTEGGYAGSRMYTETIPACAAGIVSAFGSDHILTFRDLITKAVNTSSTSSGAPFWTGASSDLSWDDTQCNLMCERMVYGMPVFSSSGWDGGVATRQFSAFRLSERLVNYSRGWWWLRDVASSAKCACVNGRGVADANYASYTGGVRPFALLK